MELKKNDLNYSLLKKSEIDKLLKIINKTEKINPSKTKTKKTKKEWLWQYKNLPTNKSFCYSNISIYNSSNSIHHTI